MLCIDTPRLTLRSFTPGDWRALQELLLDKEATPYAMYDYPAPTQEADIRRVLEAHEDDDQLIGIWQKATGRLIGYVALVPQSGPWRDLGYCLHSQTWRQGYATEACRAAIDYAFETLGLSALTSGTAQANEPSCRLLLRLGFEITGEEECAFRQDGEGRPLSFTGYTFRLSREQWAQQKAAEKQQP